MNLDLGKKEDVVFMYRLHESFVNLHYQLSWFRYSYGFQYGNTQDWNFNGNIEKILNNLKKEHDATFEILSKKIPEKFGDHNRTREELIKSIESNRGFAFNDIEALAEHFNKHVLSLP